MKGFDRVFQGLFVLVFFLTGCAAMLPSIENKHPVGYKKLLEMQPVCAEKDLKTYGACLAAAKILESVSPEQSTQRFLARWEEASFGMMAKTRDAGLFAVGAGGDPFGIVSAGVYEKVRMDELQAMEKIVLPVLRKIYEDSSSEYSSSMLRQVDLIDLGAKSSFDSFREVHSDLLKKGLAEKKE